MLTVAFGGPQFVAQPNRRHASRAHPRGLDQDLHRRAVAAGERTKRIPDLVARAVAAESGVNVNDRVWALIRFAGDLRALGQPREAIGLTLVPLYPARPAGLEYVGLDEATSSGFTVSEVGAEAVVEALLVENPLPELVLLYEGEELVGEKQNRILDQTILVGAGSTLKVPAKCVERGRWAHRTQHFAAAPRAAYPELRRAQRVGQSAVWADVAAKQERLQAFSPTGAAESMYVARGARGWSSRPYSPRTPRTS